MSGYDTLLGEENEKHFLLGNEAIVRGAIESGVGVAATYPGTPSSEVGDVLSKIAKKAGIYFEYSTNEIVALEVAASAAASGIRAFTFMKHVGLNVAADAFMSVGYAGTKAGLVIMTGDDPSMFSSQNEQDNRHYAEMAFIPLIEPSNPQEAKDFLIYSFDLSEKTGSAVLFRTTTRVSHQRANVTFGKKMEIKNKSHFIRDQNKFVLVPANAYVAKDKLIKRFENLKEFSENSPLNVIYGNGNEWGIITAGAAYNSVMDAINISGLKFDILKLGFSNPMPERKIINFLKDHKSVIIFEELDPFIESKVRIIAQMNNINSKIYGKMDSYVPWSYEFNPDRVLAVFSKLFNINYSISTINQDIKLPSRPPVLCPGCPHRATFYAVKLVSKQLRLKDPIFPNDIGCYTLGIQKPYEEADYLLCMGSSIGSGCGFSKTTDQKVISFIGDSTFFHAGIPGLINAVHNGHKFVLIILDNRTTAMTGHQPNPGLPINGMREPAPEISIEEIVKAIGVKYVKTVDPYDLKSTIIAIREAVNFDGMAVVISKRECALLRDAEMIRNKKWVRYHINQEKCTRCMNCVLNFSCPAFYVDKDGAVLIDPVLCDGCGVCSQPQVCGFHAIERDEP
ncbi:MAG: indolepyruvate ferredoxin oxidoreductase subunit alpha [Thermoplasmata archaeon]|nr:indolepyruvate ferredoxin oxidoreductase subunit alpha [Thermoplasmata archaeon]